MPLMKTEKNTCVLIVQIKVETPEYTLTNIKDYLKILYLQSLLKNIFNYYQTQKRNDFNHYINNIF